MTLPLRAELLAISRERCDRLAVDGGKAGQLTYAELFGAANNLARQITEHGAIGILSNRRPETYVAVLACFLAGVTFVPLNPGFPEERLKKVAKLAKIEMLYFDETTADLAKCFEQSGQLVSSAPQLAAAQDIEPVEWQADANAIAYRMFTSGSTGEPKGVPIPYGALDHYVRTIRDCINFPEEAKFSQFFDLSFDLSIHDIFVTFACGGTLVPASDLNLMMPHAYVAKQRIDVWFSVPMLAMSAARGLRGETGHRLSLALFCGEALPMDYVRRFRALMHDDAELWNLYGPTEATIAFTAKRVDAADERYTIATLGEPFGENRIAILDGETVTTAHDGARGELLLGGPQVFGGYEPPRHDPFVHSETGPYYRSGDIVRVEQRELIYEARTDSQVKIRGMRIELTEIETAFRNQLGCEAVAAIVYGELEAAEIRVAYTKMDGDADTDTLKKFLPPYMIPTLTLRLDELPVNANGKVDRKKLGEMTWPAPA